MLSTVNTVLLPWLQAFALAFVPGAAVLGLVVARPWLVRHRLNSAMLDGAAAAYAQAVASGVSVNSAAGLATVLSSTLAHAAGVAPSAVEGLDPHEAAQLALTALGKTLVADPGVSIGGPVVAAAVPVGGGAAVASSGAGAAAAALVGDLAAKVIPSSPGAAR